MIGAGAAGLASARWLLEEGFAPTVLERSAGLGGLWRQDTGLTYRSLRTNTSKQKTAFSDLPFDDALPDFPGRADVLAYLERFSARFDLAPHIRFGITVRDVRPGDGVWWVDGEPFAAVVVCSGLFTRAVEPALSGRERFGGSIVHSSAYREAGPYTGQDVVVVGAGSSAIDIACELAPVARSVQLSMRDVPTFTPREYRGRPFDHRTTRLARLLPVGIRAWRVRRAIADEYRRRGARLDRVRMKRTPGTDVLSEIAAGRIITRPRIASLDLTGVTFADGSRAPADAVILGTGYRVEFPFLPSGVPGTVDGAFGLYCLVFPPGVGGLAFAGMCRVFGPVFPIVELQARWIAAVLAGRLRLPPADAMRLEIASRVAKARATGGDPMRVELLDYLDEVAARLGAKPSIIRHPGLLTAPVSARDYRPRLRGP